MYKAGSCNVNSPLLSHWIHFCFPTGISPWWQMTHSSCLLSSDLTWTHHFHQILQSFPSFVMWSNFRQLKCLQLKRRSDDVPETSKARSSKTSCPWCKCIMICPFYELCYIMCACFYNLTIVQGDPDIISGHFCEFFSSVYRGCVFWLFFFFLSLSSAEISIPGFP